MSEGVARPSGKLQFTIAQALLATAFFGAIIGYAVNDGLLIAGVFAVLISLLCTQFVRTTRRWNTLVLWQRAYGCFITGALAAVLVAFATGVAWGDSPTRQRNARDLQRVLNGDSRFSSVHVEYLELKRAFLRVDGQVDSNRDLDALREIITAYDWRNMDDIWWHIAVRSPSRDYHGSDSELFGELSGHGG